MSERRRTFRVAERIREVVAWELQRAADPRFELVTVTSVMVSPDLRQAKVYWTVSGGEGRRAEAQEALDSAGSLFRRALGKDLGARFVPEIKFFYDDTLDVSENVARLMEKVK
ncbi:MAG: 30S ribosome-binding factor RbfA [Deltaproteobacteria bacterium]|nr:30S ribosome-binding factor RbfA [Deltaproteobacteria bacterium]